jgi:ribosomal protein S18 acetylase RimI-like enzyme
MPFPFVIRRTNATDGALLRDLRIAALTEAPYAFGAKLSDVMAEPLDAFQTTASRHASSDISTSFIAFAGDIAIGTVGAFVEQQAPYRAFICALWLHPEKRGSSIASELVGTACSWLRQRSGPEVFAWIADANARTLTFYRRLGFSATSDRQPLPSNPDEYEILLCLR